MLSCLFMKGELYTWYLYSCGIDSLWKESLGKYQALEDNRVGFSPWLAICIEHRGLRSYFC